MYSVVAGLPCLFSAASNTKWKISALCMPFFTAREPRRRPRASRKLLLCSTDLHDRASLYASLHSAIALLYSDSITSSPSLDFWIRARNCTSTFLRKSASRSLSSTCCNLLVTAWESLGGFQSCVESGAGI